MKRRVPGLTSHKLKPSMQLEAGTSQRSSDAEAGKPVRHSFREQIAGGNKIDDPAGAGCAPYAKARPPRIDFGLSTSS